MVLPPERFFKKIFQKDLKIDLADWHTLRGNHLMPLGLFGISFRYVQSAWYFIY